MTEQVSVSQHLGRLCMLSEARLKPKSPPQVAQVVMPPVPFLGNGKQKEEEREETSSDTEPERQTETLNNQTF